MFRFVTSLRNGQNLLQFQTRLESTSSGINVQSWLLHLTSSIVVRNQPKLTVKFRLISHNNRRSEVKQSALLMSHINNLIRDGYLRTVLSTFSLWNNHVPTHTQDLFFFCGCPSDGVASYPHPMEDRIHFFFSSAHCSTFSASSLSNFAVLTSTLTSDVSSSF